MKYIQTHNGLIYETVRPMFFSGNRLVFFDLAGKEWKLDVSIVNIIY